MCISAGSCVASVPSYFAFDDDELATVVAEAERPDDATLARVARNCPSGAISLWEGDAPVEL